MVSSSASTRSRVSLPIAKRKGVARSKRLCATLRAHSLRIVLRIVLSRLFSMVFGFTLRILRAFEYSPYVNLRGVLEPDNLFRLFEEKFYIEGMD